jgi:hypothetical protein
MPDSGIDSEGAAPLQPSLGEDGTTIPKRDAVNAERPRFLSNRRSVSIPVSNSSRIMPNQDMISSR